MKTLFEQSTIIKDYLIEKIPPAMDDDNRVPFDEIIIYPSADLEKRWLAVYPAPGNENQELDEQIFVFRAHLNKSNCLEALKDHDVIIEVLRAFDPALIGYVHRVSLVFDPQPPQDSGTSVYFYTILFSIDKDDCSE